MKRGECGHVLDVRDDRTVGDRAWCINCQDIVTIADDKTETAG